MSTPAINQQRHRNTCLVNIIFGSDFYDFVTKIIGYFFVYAFSWGVLMGIWVIIMRNHLESGQIQLFAFNYTTRANVALNSSTDLALIDQYTELAYSFFMRGPKSEKDTEKEKKPEDQYRNQRQLVRKSARARNEEKKEAERCMSRKNVSSDDGNKPTGVVNGNSLADFGVAVPYEGEVDNVAGTLSYMSAEDLEGDQNEKSDIYSFGMCVLHMMTEEAVYSEYRSEYELLGKIKSGVKPAALYFVQDKIVKKFIEKCLAKASKRPSVTDLLKHPCLATNDEGGEGSQDNREAKSVV
uniref:non-specific serine/threonine protein kinase n=1 Tax=Chenopodium quinoa TaxID=63459 RepID=A0A803MT71_CHEQI